MDRKQDHTLEQAANKVFGLIDRELWLLTSRSGEQRGGLICTFVSKAGIVPEMPRMAVGLAKQHHTCGLVEQSQQFALHLLWPDQADLVWRFGLHSGRDMDKFEGLKWQDSPLGNPRLSRCLAWMDCRVEASLDLGDRLLFTAEVTAADTQGHSLPLSVNRLYSEAPGTKREMLGQLYEHDSRVDAQAIEAWRNKD